MMEHNSPQLVAHRGYPDRYPENTLTGIRAALDAGAKYVEFDVQLTRDKQFAVIHDDTLLRTAGIEACVFDYDLEKLQTISVHEPQRFAAAYLPTPIASLYEMLQLVQQYDGVTALVEIKQESLDFWGLENVMARLLDDLAPHRERCVLITFNEQAVAYTQKHSSLRTGWVLYRYDEVHRQVAEKLQPDFLICNQTKVSDETKLWRGEWQWMLYGIEQAELITKWSKRGVFYLETDHIGKLIRS
jgi:glycerophosphoryl diester phosphodiesterase